MSRRSRLAESPKILDIGFSTDALDREFAPGLARHFHLRSAICGKSTWLPGTASSGRRMKVFNERSQEVSPWTSRWLSNLPFRVFSFLQYSDPVSSLDDPRRPRSGWADGGPDRCLLAALVRRVVLFSRRHVVAGAVMAGLRVGVCRLRGVYPSVK